MLLSFSYGKLKLGGDAEKSHRLDDDAPNNPIQAQFRQRFILLYFIIDRVWLLLPNWKKEVIEAVHGVI